MEPDPYTEELKLMQEQILAEHGGDIERSIDKSIRRQYTLGRDLYGLSKATGRIEIVFKASGPSPVSEHASP
jgi:hypothetical protein